MYKIICISLRLQGTVTSEFRLKKGKNWFRSRRGIQGLGKIENQSGSRDLCGENSWIISLGH